MPMDFRTDCRACGHDIRVPTALISDNTQGIHVRCRACDTANWAETSEMDKEVV